MSTSEKRQRTQLVAVRVTPEEKQRITAAAASVGVSAGRLLRDLALSHEDFMRELAWTHGNGWPE